MNGLCNIEQLLIVILHNNNTPFNKHTQLLQLKPVSVVLRKGTQMQSEQGEECY